MSVVSNLGPARLPNGKRFEGWANGIAFDSDLVSRDGAAFELFPVRGKHTVSDVALAKKQLRNARDVVHVYVTWQPEGSEIAKEDDDGQGQKTTTGGGHGAGGIPEVGH